LFYVCIKISALQRNASLQGTQLFNFSYYGATYPKEVYFICLGWNSYLLSEELCNIHVVALAVAAESL
jgi:hypothetical protein